MTTTALHSGLRFVNKLPPPTPVKPLARDDNKSKPDPDAHTQQKWTAYAEQMEAKVLEMSKSADRRDKEHQASLARAEKEHQGSLARAEKEHQASLARAEKEHQASLARAEHGHKEKLTSTEREHRGKLATTEKEHRDRLSSVEKEHRDKLASVEKELAGVRCVLAARVEELRRLNELARTEIMNEREHATSEIARLKNELASAPQGRYKDLAAAHSKALEAANAEKNTLVHENAHLAKKVAEQENHIKSLKPHSEVANDLSKTKGELSKLTEFRTALDRTNSELVTKLKASESRVRGFECECSRLHAENERLQSNVARASKFAGSMCSLVEVCMELDPNDNKGVKSTLEQSLVTVKAFEKSLA